ncbi:hypothetical protein RvY_10222 [Ramazzottius varieornatus]|uniref:protein disulfide-isomerase n=1 Tax=Ramazzottius varieornatus TaxID=947166 RepID=A0A1D1VC21_RAMVA|nr:hypothetical protein RvY_10222 [Ramazzottius varieornatus]
MITRKTILGWFGLSFLVSLLPFAYCQSLHHHPDHLHNPVHAEIITKHFGDTDVDFEHNVIILTKDNFYHLVGAHEILLALFHVPWDPKYNEVLLEYEKAATILQKDHPSICLGRMDVSEHPEIAKKLDVRGEEPQFMFFYKNRAYAFEHSSKAEALVKELIRRQEAAWYPPQNLPEHLIELPKEDIEKRVSAKDFAVVLYYSFTRTSSYRILMELENAVATLNISDTFFKVNVEPHKDLRNALGIPPVIKVYRKGKSYDYKGPKTTKGMVNYFRKEMSPPFHRLLSSKEVEDFLKSHQDRPTVMGYFENEKLPQFLLFTEAANRLRGELYFIMVKQFTPTTTWTEHLDAEKWRIGVILPEKDSDPDIVGKDVTRLINDLHSIEDLLKFIELKATPVVGYRTKRNKDTLYKRRPLLVGYMDIDWSSKGEKDTRFKRHRIAQAAVQYPVVQITFAISHAPDFKDEMQRFGLEDVNADNEIRLGIFGSDNEMYSLRSNERITTSLVQQFVQDYLDGKLTPYYRSEEPLPDTEQNDAVKILAAVDFKPKVLESEKDVFVSFCHPLCKVCETVEKNMLKIAEPKDYTSVEFLAMDTSLNDPPGTYPVPTYPTLYLATPKNKTVPLKYTGKDFSLKEMRKFLDRHVSVPRTRAKTEL